MAVGWVAFCLCLVTYSFHCWFSCGFWTCSFPPFFSDFLPGQTTVSIADRITSFCFWGVCCWGYGWVWRIWSLLRCLLWSYWYTLWTCALSCFHLLTVVLITALQLWLSPHRDHASVLISLSSCCSIAVLFGHGSFPLVTLQVPCMCCLSGGHSDQQLIFILCCLSS
jgi:hypothetical protein